jgi:2-(1,2-epoxy-1,2-dihydrophenyl)acetyl-CoA isomerase
MDEAGHREQGLLVERRDGVVWLRFNRPHARNAFDWAVRRLLISALEAAAADPGTRAVVIGGDQVAFSSGGDVREMTPGAPDTPEKLAAGLRIIELIADMPAPVVAAVQGHAAGAGLSIALACDVIYAADNAQLSPSFARIGLTTDLSASFWLPRALGLPRAKDLLFTGRALTAQDAADLGIVSEVWPLTDFDDLLHQRVAQLASGPTRAYASMKRLLNDSFSRGLRDQTEAEIRDQVGLVASADHEEGVRSFAERRPPRFTGA